MGPWQLGDRCLLCTWHYLPWLARARIRPAQLPSFALATGPPLFSPITISLIRRRTLLLINSSRSVANELAKVNTSHFLSIPLNSYLVSFRTYTSDLNYFGYVLCDASPYTVGHRNSLSFDNSVLSMPCRAFVSSDGCHAYSNDDQQI